MANITIDFGAIGEVAHFQRCQLSPRWFVSRFREHTFSIRKAERSAKNWSPIGNASTVGVIRPNEIFTPCDLHDLVVSSHLLAWTSGVERNEIILDSKTDHSVHVSKVAVDIWGGGDAEHIKKADLNTAHTLSFSLSLSLLPVETYQEILAALIYKGHKFIKLQGSAYSGFLESYLCTIAQEA